MLKWYTMIFIVILTFLFNSCKTNPSAPEPFDINSLPAGSRNYVWTVDTLSYVSELNWYIDIWGCDTNNVYITGEGLESLKTLLKYKNNKWYTVAHAPFMDAWSIYGFSAENYWISGEFGNLYHFNGTGFEHTDLTGMLGTQQDTWIANIRLWGDRPDNLFAVGSTWLKSREGLYCHILHYDGKEWKFLVPPSIKNVQFVDIKNGPADGPNYYLVAAEDDFAGTFNWCIYSFDGKNLKRIYRSPNVAGLFSTKGRIYFYFDKKWHKYNEKDNSFTVVRDFSSTNIDSQMFFGRNENDCFVSTTDGIGHYNGQDLMTVFKIKNYDIYDGLVLEKDVFFVGQIGNKSIAVHGKLKE